MDGQVEPSRTSSDSETDWQEAMDLLASGQYKDAAAVLEKTEAVAEANGNHDLSIVLQAAREICLAGSDFHAEVNHHERAYQAATRRERQLRQHLQALLDIIGARMGAPGRLNTPDSPAPPPQPDAVIPALLKRLQSLLGSSHQPNSQDERNQPFMPDPAAPEKPEPDGVQTRDSISGRARYSPLPALASRRAPSATGSDDGLSLTVYCLGSFELYQDDEPITQWPSGKGKSIFKYLVIHRRQPVAKEVLMDLFWPDSDPDAARNSLNVAIYGMRQALRERSPNFHHVLYEDDRYLLNRDLHIWVDMEEFRRRLDIARRLQQQNNVAAAIREFTLCEALYRGEFLAEDRYEDWVIPYRRKLQDDYLEVLEQLGRHSLKLKEYATCITICEKTLAVEPCREDAHRQLMCAYSHQSQRYLALRQYHECREALERELGVEPSQRTIDLYERIRRGESV
ncbi:MAG: AfsR/SARP family transcriptional regulator [Chloroflexota bacterium]